ncbi:MAG: twin-arginine translocase TatA/TatE family subunit [Calditrichaeota bacterium]|nr:MAG: twin-arginine translocase TatA/TatE family subunit [Calditrichota bacterium]MBL1205320.1 twin-arginine translocase TatA/TatE family subunit [Calditrichota bacterium]NOG45149.1 twin-arginine translocase TatA/TatE family subunit [Calditrichota bacterium]
MNFGTTEILIIAFIIVLLFGAKKLPDLAKGLGSSIKQFKKGMDEEEEKKKE